MGIKMQNLTFKQFKISSSQSGFIASTFPTKEDADKYLDERLDDLMGYSPSGYVTRNIDGTYSVTISSFNSCD